jgi:hypothetical protein
MVQEFMQPVFDPISLFDLMAKHDFQLVGIRVVNA